MTKNLLQIQSKMMGMFPMIPVEDYGLIHVLRAIGENPRASTLMISQAGVFAWFVGMGAESDGNTRVEHGCDCGPHQKYHDGCKPVRWNLTKPLHEQEDSVIDFLHSILCVQES